MIEHVNFDFNRSERIGMPEAVFCQGKPLTVVHSLLENFALPEAQPILFTRLAPDIFEKIPKELQESYNYDPISQTAFAKRCSARPGKVTVISAGSADTKVALEAARTLDYLGIEVLLVEDCGVCAAWRLEARLAEINTSDAVIAVAGFEGALISVLGGQCPLPIIAVPTSTGYGVCEGGKTALAAMLVSCAPGIPVMNIDNGYGAACAASRILFSLYKNK